MFHKGKATTAGVGPGGPKDPTFARRRFGGESLYCRGPATASMSVVTQRSGDMLPDEGLEILDEDQCLDLLATSTVGRVGVSVGALPAIFTVNFVLDGRDVFFKTSKGTKLAAAARHAVVAFQCDSVDPQHRGGWSVLMVGRAIPVTDPDQIAQLERLGIEPWAGGNRSIYVRIPVEFVSGRRIVRPSEP